MLSLLAAAALLLGGCSKTTITIDEGGNTSSQGSSGSSDDGTAAADNLVGFHATVESINMTRSMSPIAEGTVVRIFAYHGGTDETHSTSPMARGTYTAQQAGMLTGQSGYKMYLSNGTFDFYASRRTTTWCRRPSRWAPRWRSPTAWTTSGGGAPTMKSTVRR